MPTKPRVKPVASQSTDRYAGRVGIPYVRVSDKSQELNGSGRTSQETRCKIHLENIGVPFDKSFMDTYTGGGDFMRRPAMRALLEYIDASPHKNFLVVFDDLSRLARDVEFHIKLRAEFKARDVLLECLNYNFDDSPEGEYVETIIAATYELQRKQNRRQVVQKMKARLDSGYWPFAKMRGYDMVIVPGRGKVGRPNKIGLEVIKPALEAFAAGNLPRKVDVVNYLKEHGLWEGISKEQCMKYVTSLLEESYYCGDVEYGPWEVKRHPGHHEPLIGRDTFARIQARLKKNEANIKPHKRITEDFPLRGLLNCAECAGHLSAAPSKGRTKNYPYYLCQTKGCSRKGKVRGMGKKVVEKRFSELLERNRLKPKVEKVAASVFERVWKQEAEIYRWQEQMGEQRKTELKKKLKELSELARKAHSEAVVRTYETQMDETALELEQMENSDASRRDIGIPYRTALDKSMGMLKSPVSTWDLFDVHGQHRLFFFLFEAKLAYDQNEGYRTGDELSKTRLFEELATTDSYDVDRTGFEPATLSLQMRCSTN